MHTLRMADRAPQVHRDWARVCVDRRSSHILVTEKLLHHASVVARLQQMGAQAMTKGMWRDALRYLRS